MIDDRHENPDTAMAALATPPLDSDEAMHDSLVRGLRRCASDPQAATPERFENSATALEAIHARQAAEVDRLRGQVAAFQQHHHALGQHLIAAHKPGEVDEEAVAILDGYHVGGRKVAGGGAGEPGETTLDAALRLLKLAKERGAFAVRSAPTGPTFRVAEIDSPEAIPEWARASFPDWALNGFSNDRTDERSCIAILSHGAVEFHWDGGEPEDNTYGRDWAWVHGAIASAYGAGFDDARSGAVPTTWAEICDKVRALSLRCYIRGGEGVETALMIDGPAVYFAPEGVAKHTGTRVADIHDSTTGQFTPRLVGAAVVPFERLTADVMTVPIEEFVDGRMLRVRLNDLDTGGDFLKIGRDRGELAALRWALATAPAKETP